MSLELIVLPYINLNILECKYSLNCYTSFISLFDINLNILECKCILASPVTLPDN